jgi:hypothetical protein
MCWILWWKKCHYKCNLNNLNSGDFYIINAGNFAVRPEFTTDNAIALHIHKYCNIEFGETDLSLLEVEIKEHGGIRRVLREKYIRAFFVKFVYSITDSMPGIIASSGKPKAIVALGYANALQLLCGYMKTPITLDVFLTQLFLDGDKH